MSEAAFPLLGTAFVMLAVLPAAAVLAKGALWAMERSRDGGALQRLKLRYLVLVGSTALPLAWLLSAGVHQVEEAQSAIACLLEHDAAADCFEPGFFAAALALVVLGLSFKSLRAASGAHVSRSPRARGLERRIARIVDGHPSVRALESRVRVTEEHGFALATQGVVRPRVIVGLSYAAGLEDDALAGALGHEAEHVRAHDPLRYLVLSASLAVNPFGRWLLDPHARRWLAARETHCDREAVMHGAAPLSLAAAIVQAARPTRSEVVALGAPDTSVLRLRIGLLFAFAEKRPAHRRRRGPSAVAIALALVAVALVLPHHTGTEALDAVHAGVEQAFTYFWR